jgi:endogenous inhibitor of DNA gyrase (YacG/DUF329 family)
MKFDELYKNTKYVEFEGTAIIKGEKEHKCWHCGEKTVWFDSQFLVPLCSEECCRAKWDEYIEETIKSNERVKNKTEGFENSTI